MLRKLLNPGLSLASCRTHLAVVLMTQQLARIAAIPLTCRLMTTTEIQRRSLASRGTVENTEQISDGSMFYICSGNEET